MSDVLQKATLLARAAEVEESTSWIVPTHAQWVTIYFLQAYVILLLLCWNLKYARTVIYPLKLLTVAFHESSHANMGTLTGGRVQYITLDPNQGDKSCSSSDKVLAHTMFCAIARATAMTGGWPFLSLPAGYIGATTIGAALIFAGFDQKASKIALFPILFIMAEVSWWARKDPFVLCHITGNLGVLVLLLFVQHGAYLRFFVLLIGTTNVMYTVWDILDDLVFQKIEESDCSAFAREYPWIPSQAWGAIWFTFALSALLAGTLGGLALFKDNFEEQYLNSMTFMPT